MPPIDLATVQFRCINLDRRPDRWSAFQARATAGGLRVTRLSAVDAKTFDAVRHPDVSIATAHNLMYGIRRSPYEISSNGAIGASLSHFAAWQQLVDSVAPAAVIFEDDSPIPSGMQTRIADIVTGLDAVGDWDIVLFFRTGFGNGVYGCAPDPTLPAGFQTCDSLSGAHAYMISRTGAQKLLARARPIELHVDAFMAYMARLGYIRMLWHPSLDVGGNWEDSDINHKGGRILELPTNMERAGIYAMDTRTMFAVVAMAAIVGGLVGVAMFGKTKLGKRS